MQNTSLSKSRSIECEGVGEETWRVGCGDAGGLFTDVTTDVPSKKSIKGIYGYYGLHLALYC